MKLMSLPFSLLLPVLTAIPPAAAFQPAQNWLIEQGYVAPAGNRIIACHGYGCSRRLAVIVDEAWLSRANAILKAGRNSPDAERRALGEVVGKYTAYLAASLGGKPDAPGSPPGLSGVHGQMDCVDESANTTSLLLILQEQGFLAHHEVRRPQSRGFFIDGRYPHTSAIIAERRTGSEWAVDPWDKPPGQRPNILPLVLWRQNS